MTNLAGPLDIIIKKISSERQVEFFFLIILVEINSVFVGKGKRERNFRFQRDSCSPFCFIFLVFVSSRCFYFLRGDLHQLFRGALQQS